MGVAESIPFSLRGSSVSSLEGRAPRAADGGSLLGILCWETGAEVCRGSPLQPFQGPWRCKLMAMAMSWGGAMVSAREWVSTGVVVGA